LGEWTDKIITEPIDFKSSIADNKNINTDKEPIPLPRAVEVSVGLFEPDYSDEGLEPYVVEMPPTIIPIQSGMIFERFEEKEEEDNNAPQKK
jgi:hypothetical protein